jgi:adenylate cyclase
MMQQTQTNGTTFLSKLFRTPYGIKPINFRFFVVLNISSILAFILHIMFLGFFLFLRIPFMIFFNIGSCVIFIFCFIVNRQGLHKTAIFLAFFEVIIHAILAITFIGWDSGFYYYVFCLVPLIFYIPRIPVRIKIGFSTLLLLIYGAAYWYIRLLKPLFVIDPNVLLGCHYVNLISLFVVLACVAYYYSLAAHLAQEEVERQHKISEGLLLNILPRKIAEKLKRFSGIIAERHPEATILFADIADFTKLTTLNEPEKIIRLLNKLFSDFDTIAEKLGLEKIKTIGDAYMAASGLPEPRKDHALVVAEFALGIRNTVAAFNAKAGKNIIRMRIGINSGSVIAGVIGKKKFTYDLWGESVNIAARMESLCPENRIHVSEETARLLDEKYILTLRGEMEVKGFKGRIKTFFLEGKKEQVTSAEQALVDEIIDDDLT